MGQQSWPARYVRDSTAPGGRQWPGAVAGRRAPFNHVRIPVSAAASAALQRTASRPPDVTGIAVKVLLEPADRTARPVPLDGFDEAGRVVLHQPDIDTATDLSYHSSTIGAADSAASGQTVGRR